MILRIVLSLLVAVIVFLGVLFILNPLLPGIGAYAGLVAVLAGFAYFLAHPYISKR